MVLRRHYLPAEPDSDESYARALWLDRRYWENHKHTVAGGIVLAWEGE